MSGEKPSREPVSTDARLREIGKYLAATQNDREKCSVFENVLYGYCTYLLRLCSNLREQIRQMETLLAERLDRATTAESRVRELEAEVARLREDNKIVKEAKP